MLEAFNAVDNVPVYLLLLLFPKQKNHAQVRKQQAQVLTSPQNLATVGAKKKARTVKRREKALPKNKQCSSLEKCNDAS